MRSFRKQNQHLNLKKVINNLKWFNLISNLPNRYMFINKFNEMLAGSSPCGAVLLLNITSFKLIYNGYGPYHGKLFLAQIIDFLESIQAVKDQLYHFDSDEFVIILRNIEVMKNVIDTIKTRFNDIWIIDSNEYYCSLILGVVIYPKNGRDADTIIKNLYIAVNTAKNRSKDNVVFFRKNEEKRIFNRFRKEQMMRQAVANECSEFISYFQPLIDAKTGDWVGAEALLRWVHPIDGIISPAEFIPMAEYMGLISIIGKHVLYNACKTCKEWNDMGYQEMSVSVNLSINQLYEKNFADAVFNILTHIQLEPSRLTLEITENIAMYDLKKTTGCLNKLRNLGIKISLDDFGKGYSSLSNLKLLPLDHIKIDRSFICDMNKDNYHFTFIKTIIELAHSIDLLVYCEGIEYEEQFKQIRVLGADFLQGYHFSKPLQKEEFLKKLKAIKK